MQKRSSYRPSLRDRLEDAFQSFLENAPTGAHPLLRKGRFIARRISRQLQVTLARVPSRWALSQAAFLAWLRHTFWQPDFTRSREYQEARNWLNCQFQPLSDEPTYESALEYAWKKYDEVLDGAQTLDKKADNLMRNAGLVAGLIGIAINTLKIPVPELLFPSLICFVISLALAALACNPAPTSTPTSVEDLLEDISAGHRTVPWMAASLHIAITGRGAVNTWKAARIRWATGTFCAGLLLFLLPVAIFYFCPSLH